MKLKLQCEKCKQWNQIEVDKVFLKPENPEPKVQVYLPSYLSTQIQKCVKCGVVLCKPDELFRIENGEAVRYKMRNV